MKTKRIFIAIKVQPDLFFKESLEKIRNSLSAEDIRWLDTDNFHITLRFIGDTDSGLIPEIHTRLEHASNLVGHFDIQLSGLGIFRSVSYPKVIYAGILDNSGNLNSLKTNIDIHLNDIFPPVMENYYSPHLTLGRMNRIMDKNSLRKLLNTYQTQPLMKMTVRGFTLYESVFFSKGVKYEVVNSYKLSVISH